MITMNDDELDSPKAIKVFLGGADKLKFSVPKSNCYAWVANTLKRTGYLNLSKKDKGPVREYMELMTGYSWSQLKRLIAQYRERKWIGQSRLPRHTITKRYTHNDICLLVQMDEALKPSLNRLYEKHGAKVVCEGSLFSHPTEVLTMQV